MTLLTDFSPNSIPGGPARPDDTAIMRVFDRRLVAQRRDRAAQHLAAHAFLLDEVGARLVDRLGLIRRTFSRILDLGSHDGRLSHRLLTVRAISEQNNRHEVICCDLSRRQIAVARAGAGAELAGAVVADEEWLPFRPGSFDLVLSNLSLHWVNDLPGCLIQIRRLLRPDGLFLAAMPGGDTLHELRQALMDAELALSGGFAPRISPFAHVRDAGALLQRAGFALPTVDTDVLTVSYENLFRLLADLRGMGETNASLARHRRPVGRTLFTEAARRYTELFAEADGRLPATFQILYLCGWAPAESQPKPIRRGSATTRLAEALDTEEGKL